MKTILASLNAKFVHSNLAIRYIKAYSHEYDIEIFETSINDGIMDAAINIIEKKPDLVGFSCYIWNIGETLKVCSIIKDVLPNTLILFGGPEVSYSDKEYLENYDFVDYIIQGEGEKIFKDFMNVIANGKSNFETVDGLIFRRASAIIKNSKAQPIQNLDTIPFPYASELPDKILYYEAARGCPFNCTYCLSGDLKGVRFFSIDRVKSDLKVLIDKQVPLVKFVDRTFNANKKFAIEIWDFLIKNRGVTKFHFEIAADIIDDEMIEILKNAPKDLFQFEIGVQTTNSKILKNINRVMDFNRVKENIIKIKKNGNIHCHVDLIAGLPGENIQSFINSFDMCMEIPPHVLQLGFLKVLKGSQVYREKEKYGIHYISHPNYHVLYTSDMSFDDIRNLLKLEKVFEIYYNSGIFNICINYLLANQKSKFSFFSRFTDFLAQRDFFNRKFDFKDKFRALYDFGLLYNDENIIKDMLIHDFIINTKKSVLPEFLKKEQDKNIKNILYKNKEFITSIFGEFDVKKIFAIPVAIKILNNYNNYKVENESSIVAFNLSTGEYCYIS